MKSFTKHYFISAPIDKVWKALTDAETIKLWLGEEVTFSDKAGESFSMWNGDIHGRNLAIITNQSLEQEWYGGKWEQPSLVTFTLVQLENNRVEIVLKHDNVPDIEADSISGGWDTYYIGPMKEWCEKAV